MSRLTYIVLAILAAMFFLTGLAIVPYIGIQNDEAVFTSVLFDHPTPWFALSIFKKKIGLMVMSYLGSTKAALYWLVWRVFEPSAYSLRVPVLLIGVASLICFHRLLWRTTNPRIALFGAALLATDPSYLMMTVFDWGPVAIQHFCLLAGMLLLLTAFQTERLAPLAGGSFALGLGMWDKALFAWMLSGAVIAAVAVFHGEIRRFVNLRRAATAAAFFLLGALPLVIYNVRRPLETFRGNARFSSEGMMSKLYQLPSTANGSALFGFVVEENGRVEPRTPVTALERASVALSQLAGERRKSLSWYALVVSLMSVPVLLFTRFRRLALFSVIMMSVAWGQMLATHGAGGGAHHTVLLWPFPLLLISLAAAALATRLGRFEVPFLVVLATVLCSAAMLVNNHHLSQAIRNGGAASWTNAYYNLVAALPRYQATKIFLIDWGLLDNTRMLFRGRLPLHLASEPLMRAEPTPADLRATLRVLEQPDSVFVSNTDDRQFFPDVNSRLKRMASELGYRREALETVYDFNGRPCFEIFRFGK